MLGSSAAAGRSVPRRTLIRRGGVGASVALDKMIPLAG
jgi:hypothetical protein